MAATELPEIVEIDDVLTEEQCDRLVATFGGTVKRSMVFGEAGSRIEHRARTSSSVKIQHDSLPEDVRSALADRLGSICGFPESHHESWEAIRYREREHYGAHYDLDKGAPVGNREFSAVLFLRAPEAGGETVFPMLARSIKPRPGKLIVWNNTGKTGSMLITSLHGSAPVIKGEKWSMVTWIGSVPRSTA